MSGTINCILKINSASDGQYKIRVNGSGELYVYESLLTPQNTAFKYRFEVHGKLWANHSTIEYMWGDEDVPPYTGGIQIYGAPSEVWLNNTNVWKSGANGIHIMNAMGVNITGNSNITDNTRMEVYANNSKYINFTDSDFTDYVDYRAGHGIWFRHSQYINISHSYIAGHNGDNIRLNNTTYSSVTHCKIGVGADWDNYGSGIGLDYCDSTLRIAWNNISDHMGTDGLTYVSKSSPIVENNWFTNNVDGISNWGDPKSWNSIFYIYNNTLINNVGEGISMFGSTATITNNTLIVDNIVMRNSTARIEECYIQGGNTIKLTDSNPIIVNSTLKCGVNSHSFNIENDSHPIALNCTVDFWDHMYVWDALSNVTVQNYLHVNVVEEDGSTPIAGAWVNVTDDGVLTYSGLTDSNGEVRWIPVTNRTYLQDYWNPFHPFENITYNSTIVQVEKGDLVFIDNPRIIGMNHSHWELFQVELVMNISLLEGWNLISFPVEQPRLNGTPIHRASDIYNVTNCIDLAIWNSTNQNYTIYIPGFNLPTDPENFIIGEDDAVFVWWNETYNGTFNLTGYAPGQRNVSLKSGWNMVGYKSLAVGDVETLWAPQVSAGAYDDICWFDGQTFVHYIYPGTGMQLVPTRDYFVWSDVETWLGY